MAEKINLFELDVDIAALTKKQSDALAQIQTLRDGMKSLDKTTEEGRLQFVKQEAQLKTLTTEYNKNKKVLSEVGVESKSFAAIKENINQLTNKEIVSVDGARKSNKELLAIRNQLNTKTVEGQRAAEQINEKLDKNNALIKENVSQYEKQKIGIGDYTGGIKKAFPQLNGLITSIEQSVSTLAAQKGALAASTAGTTGLTKATKLLKLAFISLGIGAIAVALGALVTYLTTTQAGMDQLTKVTKPLQVIFSKLLGVAQKLGGTLAAAFNNPQKAVEDLINYIKNSSFVQILDGIVNMDFDQVADGIKNMGKGFADAAKSTANFFGEAIDQGNKLRQIAIDIEQAEAEIGLQRAKSLDQIKDLELISKDTSRSAKERNEAGEKAVALSRELAEQEKGLIQLKIQEEELNQSLNDSGRKDLKVLNDLKAQLYEKDRTQKALELRFIGAKSALNKEIQAQEKAAVEEAIKLNEKRAAKELETLNKELEYYILTNQSKLDSELELTEEILAEEENRLQAIREKKLEILEAQKLDELDHKIELTKINQEYLASKKELESEFRELEKERLLEEQELEAERYEQELELKRLRGVTESQIKLEQLQATLEAEKEKYKGNTEALLALEKKFQEDKKALDLATSQAKLENAESVAGQIASLFKEESTLGKLAALAQAGINIAVGVTKAIAQGGLAGIATGATVAAAGAKQISKIQKLRHGGVGIDVGGKPHSQGGTKYYGEDGNVFEVEKGEKMFVLNNLASPFAHLLQGLNSSINHPTAPSSGTFRNGGFPSLGNNQVPVIDYDKMAAAFKAGASQIPQGKIILDEITSAQMAKQKLERNATIG